MTATIPPWGYDISTIAQELPYNLGNALRSIWAATPKNKELDKAIQYLEMEDSRREKAAYYPQSALPTWLTDLIACNNGRGTADPRIGAIYAVMAAAVMQADPDTYDQFILNAHREIVRLYEDLNLPRS
ncbi:hypothetical protein [Corynebacterium phocae]|nr:hypothetical protein [Corynebacterium phocae]KAA8723254.1 hypothetical protein F4V58_08030 [Corynebacterium phocae]